jgi:hypothetical protein
VKATPIGVGLGQIGGVNALETGFRSGLRLGSNGQVCRLLMNGNSDKNWNMVLDGNVGAALGLALGIILGSLLLNLPVVAGALASLRGWSGLH